MEHSNLLPECKQIFLRLEEKIDSLINRADKINGRYEKHINESELHRYSVTILWFVAQGIKWAIGGGILTTLILFIMRKV